MPILNYLNTGPIYRTHPEVVHGRHNKDMIVLHETISHDLPGLTDIKSVENYLVQVGYGIHGMTDKEGNIAWARGFGNAVLYHCGGVNERSIGIEQVSYPPNKTADAITYWKNRGNQLRATAKLCAAISRFWDIPLIYSDGDHPGITTHWSVSQIYPQSEGHTDCYPKQFGGYYPALYVISLARRYSLARYSLV